MRYKEKYSNRNNFSQNQNFFGKATNMGQNRSLSNLKRIYHLLHSPNPSGDRNRHHLRAIQLAQQLINPQIQSVQPILADLKKSMEKLQSGSLSFRDRVGMEDSCRRYPLTGYGQSSCAEWINFALCFMQIPTEDSIIETDVYNYADPRRREPIEVVESESLENSPEVETPVLEESPTVEETPPVETEADNEIPGSETVSEAEIENTTSESTEIPTTGITTDPLADTSTSTNENENTTAETPSRPGFWQRIFGRRNRRTKN